MKHNRIFGRFVARQDDSVIGVNELQEKINKLNIECGEYKDAIHRRDEKIARLNQECGEYKDAIHRRDEIIAVSNKKIEELNKFYGECKDAVSRRDILIARLKEAGENLIQLANFGNEKAAEYTDAWSALMEELEK